MTMDAGQAFSGELLPDERIEWTGRPNPSIWFHQEDWLVIPFSLLWGGFAIFWLLGASGLWDPFAGPRRGGFGWFGVVWGTPFVLMGQYMIWGRFLYRRWQKQRAYDALTNRRALIVQYGPGGRSSSSAFFGSLPVIDKRIRGDGIGTISFGGPVRAELALGRNHAPRPLTFDDVDQAETAYRIAIRLNGQDDRAVAPTLWQS